MSLSVTHAQLLQALNTEEGFCGFRIPDTAALIGYPGLTPSKIADAFQEIYGGM